MQLKRKVMAVFVALMLIATAGICIMLLSSLGGDMPYFSISADKREYLPGETKITFEITPKDGADLRSIGGSVDIIRLPDSFRPESLLGPPAAFGQWCNSGYYSYYWDQAGSNNYVNGTRVATLTIAAGSSSLTWNGTIDQDAYRIWYNGVSFDLGDEAPYGKAPAGYYIAVPVGRPCQDSDAKWVLDMSSTFHLKEA